MTEKEERIEKLKKLVLQCSACSLVQERPKMVFGDGSLNAIVMFLGEAPGKDEQKLGLPFVGRSGKLLRKMIAAIDIPIEDFYIANIIKDRPPNNRIPEKEEIAACVKFLKKQIEIICPKFLVLLGKTAVKGLFPEHTRTPVDALRNSTKNLGFLTYEQLPAIVTYHPSALLQAPWRKIGAAEDFKFIQAVYGRFK